MAETESGSNMRDVIVLIVALVIGAVFLLTPVKGWLNSHPLVFKVVFPALLVFTVYGLVMALREHTSWRTWLPWCVALIAALAASLWAFGAGAFFYTVGRITAILFVVLEIVLTILDVARPEQT